jgi:translation initiation factor 1 (eIF-1/SUI1)
MIRRGHVSLDPDAPGAAVVRAHQELARLDDTIAQRQAARMGHGVTTLETLGFEIEFFERYDSHLAARAACGETAEKSALDDGETLDLEPDRVPQDAP